ncbi:MAG: hypothetical protein ACPHGY_03710 [Rhodospirillaceae bacterium]
MIDGFINGFCKVEFLCYAGDPNWLGWIVLVIGGLFLLMVGLVIGLMLFATIIESFHQDPQPLVGIAWIIIAIVSCFGLVGLGLFD